MECELNEISEMPSGESEKPASRLYPSLSGYMNGNWGRIRKFACGGYNLLNAHRNSIQRD